MAFNKYGEWFALNYQQNIGTTNQVYSFTAPFNCRIMELQSTAAAADGTDKVTVSVAVAGDTKITGVVVDAAAETQRITSPDAGKTLLVDAGQKITVTFTYAGTAANVLSPAAVLWLQPVR